ncbi:endonuclease domain-containing 1 protein-like [Paramisgurnus dabryanus]|uniref:endonuclease domain-containing 1 protein-like n=1 Tax=Paramisgurnus dabryanus TaxID=90735 RepID=UPI0031F365DF
MFLLPVMLLLFSGGSAEVVDDFINKCPQYFMDKITPKILSGNQYKEICQTLGNITYYATLYDTDNKIPVYSAYNLAARVQCVRLNNWLIEPQLDNFQGNNMERQNKRILLNQASDKDYEKSGYDRGHLAPVYHAASQECAGATFTLTNAAPQLGSFNKKWYHEVEKNMASTVTNQCLRDTAHIVTGVVPGTNIIANRVRVPSHFWSAYCCKNQANQRISGGVIGENSQNSTIAQKTVKDLETDLKTRYSVTGSFYLFDNNCRDATYVPVKP